MDTAGFHKPQRTACRDDAGNRSAVSTTPFGRAEGDPIPGAGIEPSTNGNVIMLRDALPGRLLDTFGGPPLALRNPNRLTVGVPNDHQSLRS